MTKVFTLGKKITEEHETTPTTITTTTN